MALGPYSLAIYILGSHIIWCAVYFGIICTIQLAHNFSFWLLSNANMLVRVAICFEYVFLLLVLV